MADRQTRTEVRLTPDQFVLNEKGELVIKDDQLTELIKNQSKAAEVTDSEAGGVSVEVSVGVSI